MSIEQTSQLIQLLLNSVLTVIACGMVLMGLVNRQTAIALQLQTLRSLRRDRRDRPSSAERMAQRQRLARLHRQQRTCQTSSLIAHWALALLLANLLVLSLRTVWNQSGLIHASFFLFIGGVALLFITTGLVLLDWSRAPSAMLQIGPWSSLPTSRPAALPLARSPITRRRSQGAQVSQRRA
ncbi:MAG: hypothetical protein KME20_13160 [Kaiparowitsia implicata GSE-PSE-MK54-09C]|jgi:hypothetical protein|nr:hypothetical protein [Kaiparowitsia implicata GSE-PSE-MK54-09C]